jgi:hypothetical protein
VEQLHKLVLVIFHEFGQILAVETVEYFCDKEQSFKQDVEIVEIRLVGINQTVNCFEKVQKWSCKGVQNKLDFQKQLVRTKLVPPALENRVRSLQNTEINLQIVQREPGNQVLVSTAT